MVSRCIRRLRCAAILAAVALAVTPLSLRADGPVVTSNTLPSMIPAIAKLVPSPTPTVAVADFCGTNNEVGGFVADALMTELDQSRKLRVLECVEVRGALSALKLQPANLLDPHQVRLLSQRTSADLLVVGSYLLQEDQIFINARLLNLRSGQPAPGGAGRVSGNRQELLVLAHRLAEQIHQRITGSDLEADSAPAVAAISASEPASSKFDTESYTGLIIDADDLPVQRAMGPRILDEDGRILYPDPKHVPDVGYLEDHGMVAYVTDERDAPRCGKHPLISRAIKVSGPAHEDLVVSKETAEQIRQADQRDGFLGSWAVSIRVRPR